jgi:thioredoxin 1
MGKIVELSYPTKRLAGWNNKFWRAPLSLISDRRLETEMKPGTQVNETNFKSEVLDSTQPVIVDFGTGGAVHMKMIASVSKKLRKYAGGVKIATVQVNESPVTGKHCRIWTIPRSFHSANGLTRSNYRRPEQEAYYVQAGRDYGIDSGMGRLCLKNLSVWN